MHVSWYKRFLAIICRHKRVVWHNGNVRYSWQIARSSQVATNSNGISNGEFLNYVPLIYRYIGEVALLFVLSFRVAKRWRFDIFTDEYELQANDFHPPGYGGLTVNTRLGAIGSFHVIDQTESRQIDERTPHHGSAGTKRGHCFRFRSPGNSERINMHAPVRAPKARFIAVLHN